jgi:hypothetical protein
VLKEVNLVGREVEKGLNWAGNQIDQSIKQCETGAILVCTILLLVVNYLFLNLVNLLYKAIHHYMFCS